MNHECHVGHAPRREHLHSSARCPPTPSQCPAPAVPSRVASPPPPCHGSARGDLARLVGMRAVAFLGLVSKIDSDVYLSRKATVVGGICLAKAMFWDRKYQVSIGRGVGVAPWVWRLHWLSAPPCLSLV